jgi:hypothetical protein
MFRCFVAMLRDRPRSAQIVLKGCNRVPNCQCDGSAASDIPCLGAMIMRIVYYQYRVVGDDRCPDTKRNAWKKPRTLRRRGMFEARPKAMIWLHFSSELSLLSSEHDRVVRNTGMWECVFFRFSLRSRGCDCPCLALCLAPRPMSTIHTTTITKRRMMS